MRTLGTIIGVMAVATLMTQAIVFSFYWSQGTLNPQSLQDMKMIMQGHDPAELLAAEEDEEKETETPSHQDISASRATRLVDLHQQSLTLGSINELMVERAKEIEEAEKELKTQRATYQKEISDLLKRINSEDVQRTRGIIQAMKPDTAKVAHLMELDLKDCVIIIKGMEDKEIAKILNAFSDPTQREEVQVRGKSIFMEINNGEPINTVARNAQQAAQTN